jgi:hypothetical protein
MAADVPALATRNGTAADRYLALFIPRH